MKRISKNLLAITASDAGRRLIGFFTVAYMARTLGAAEFGVINIGFTVLTYAIMTGAGGLGTLGAREVARGAVDIANPIMSLRLVAAIVVYAAVVAISLTMIADPLVVQVICVACCSLFANAVLLEWFFQGREAMGMIGIGRLISAIVYAILVVLLVRGPRDVVWVAGAAVAGDLVASGIIYATYRRRYGVPFRFRLTGGMAMIRRSFQIGLGATLAHVSINLPTILIGILLSTSDAGLYSAAQKLVFFLLIIDRVLGTVLFPAAARFIASSTETLAQNLSFALRWLFVAALPVALGGTLLSDQIVGVVFGSQYAAAGPVFRILIWYFFFTILHTVYTTGLVAIGEEARYSRVMIASAAVYAVAVVIGTKFYGITGAASGIVLGEAVTLVLMRYEFKKFVRTTLRSAVIPVLVSAAVMSIAVVALAPMNLFLLTGAGAIVYAGSLLLTKGVTVRDLQELAGRLA